MGDQPTLTLDEGVYCKRFLTILCPGEIYHLPGDDSEVVYHCPDIIKDLCWIILARLYNYGERS